MAPKTSNSRLDAALHLARRMPAAAAPATLEAMLTLLPKSEASLAEELVERVEQPLEKALDDAAGRPFLLTAYNRDGDSHRSPWSNTYYPHLEEVEEEGAEPPYYPSDTLRALEAEANELWPVYLELYYGGEAVGSVYLWELEGGAGGAGGGAGGDDVGAGGFAGCFAVKKQIQDGPGGLREGAWDALHVVEALPAADGRSATYKLTSSVLLSLAVRREATVGEMDVAGSLTRQAEASHSLASGAGALPPAQQHLAHMGRMIEDMEIQQRGDLDALYLQRTREVVHAMRRGGGGGGGLDDLRVGEGAAEERRGPKRPPVGGIRLPGMPMPGMPGMGAAVPAGHQQSLFEAINRRRMQRQQGGEEAEQVVEG